jgi:TetR/AcrR family transcriptional regulator
MLVIMTLERKEKEKEQRRNLIIDAAQTLFFTKPYDQITIEAIAEKAQLAKGTLYLYFKSKDELYVAVALRGERILNSMFKKSIEGKKNGLEKAFATGEAYYEFYKRHAKYFQMCLEAENQLVLQRDNVNSKDLMKVSCENVEMVLNAVVEGTKDGSIKPDLDPMLTSIFLIQSTRAMIQLPPGFEMFLQQAGADKDATLKFTLRALLGSMQNVQTEKVEEV